MIFWDSPLFSTQLRLFMYKQIFFYFALSLIFPMTNAEAQESAPSDGTVVDMVVATVDGEPLTMGDLRHYISRRGEHAEGRSKEAKARMQKYLRDLVLEVLITKEAKESNISIGDDEIDAYVEEIKRQNKVNDENFKRVLAEKGLSIEQYRTQVRKDMLRIRLVSSKLRSKVNVVDEDIKRYLQDHPNLLPQSGSIHLQQIMLRFTDSDKEEVYDAISRMRERLLKGEDWSTVGTDNYNDMGYVKLSDLREPLQLIVKKLKVGEVSQIVPGERDYSLFMVSSTGGQEGEIDDKLKEQIRNQIYQSRINERAEKYLNEDLPKKYHVELML